MNATRPTILANIGRFAFPTLVVTALIGGAYAGQMTGEAIKASHVVTGTPHSIHAPLPLTDPMTDIVDIQTVANVKSSDHVKNNVDDPAVTVSPSATQQYLTNGTVTMLTGRGVPNGQLVSLGKHIIADLENGVSRTEVEAATLAAIQQAEPNGTYGSLTASRVIGAAEQYFGTPVPVVADPYADYRNEFMANVNSQLPGFGATITNEEALWDFAQASFATMETSPDLRTASFTVRQAWVDLADKPITGNLDAYNSGTIVWTALSDTWNAHHPAAA